MIPMILLLLCGPALAGGTTPEPGWNAAIGELATTARQTAEQTSQNSAGSQDASNKAIPAVVPMPATSEHLKDKTSNLLMNKYYERIAVSRHKLPKLDLDEVETIKVGEAINGPTGLLKRVEDDVKDNGTAIKMGDPVMITAIEFDKKRITIDLNGGGPKTKKFSERQMTIEGARGAGVTINPGSRYKRGAGVTLVYEFSKDLPEMTLQEFQALLEPFLDFNQIKDTVSTSILDNVPDEFKVAVQEGEFADGMDEDTAALAASLHLGEPDVKYADPPVCAVPPDLNTVVSCRRTPGAVWIQLPQKIWVYNLGATSCEVIFQPALDQNNHVVVEYKKLKWRVATTINSTSNIPSCTKQGK